MAHPSVQQLLAAMWYEGLPGFRRKTLAAQVQKNITQYFILILFCLQKNLIFFPFKAYGRSPVGCHVPHLLYALHVESGRRQGKISEKTFCQVYLSFQLLRHLPK